MAKSGTEATIANPCVTLVTWNSGFDVKGFENRPGKHGRRREKAGERGRTRENANIYVTRDHTVRIIV